MARRIFLHIGVMKSATSYLQGLCEQNRAALAAGGLHWCPEDLRYQAVRDLLGKGGGVPDPSQGWGRLLQDLEHHHGDALISNELLAGLGVRQIRRLVAGLPDGEVRVVITARDLSRIIPSHWQTTIKNRRVWPWADFAAAVCSDPEADRPAVQPGLRTDDSEEQPESATTNANTWFWRRHDLTSIVDRWSSSVPVARMSLVTIPSDASDLTTVATRFGSVIDVDLVGLEEPEERRNPTLGAHSAELLRRLNGPMARTPLDDPEHRYERALGAALAAQAELEPRFALDQEQQDWVRQRAVTMIAELERLGLEVAGELSDLVPDARATPGAVDPGDTSDAELLAAAARGLVGMAPVFNELRVERDELKRLLAAETPAEASPASGRQGLEVDRDSRASTAVELSRSLGRQLRSRFGRRVI